MYNGEGIVVDIVEGEGRKIVIECEGLVIALFCLVRWGGKGRKGRNRVAKLKNGFGYFWPGQ